MLDARALREALARVPLVELSGTFHRVVTRFDPPWVAAPCREASGPWRML